MTIKPVSVLLNRNNELKNRYKNFPPSSSDEDFEARCNETDHFIFICSKCSKYAIVILVELDKLVGPIGPMIRIELWCKSCGLRGQRKIYLKGDLQPPIPIEEPYDDEDDPDP